MTGAEGFTPVADLTGAGEMCGASVILQDADGRLLMQLRDDRPHVLFGGHWCFFGGGVEPGEDLKGAAIREIEEETGVTLSPDTLHPFALTVSTRADRNRLYVFRSAQRVHYRDIRPGEGAGFAFLTRAQANEVRLIPSLVPVLNFFCREIDE